MAQQGLPPASLAAPPLFVHRNSLEIAVEKMRPHRFLRLQHAEEQKAGTMDHGLTEKDRQRRSRTHSCHSDISAPRQLILALVEGTVSLEMLQNKMRGFTFYKVDKMR